MTTTEFFDRVEKYYGPYEPGDDGGDGPVKKVVRGYIEQMIAEDKLRDLWRMLIKSHSQRFGPPDPSDVEKAIGEWGAKDGVDVRRRPYYQDMVPPLTEEERRQNDRFLEALAEQGGISALLRKKAAQMRAVKGAGDE